MTLDDDWWLALNAKASPEGRGSGTLSTICCGRRRRVSTTNRVTLAIKTRTHGDKPGSNCDITNRSLFEYGEGDQHHPTIV